jgi:PAT family acetyl-CoA transporter-like MFS transporter 1
LCNMTVVVLEDESKQSVHEKPNIKGDRANIIILTSLYVLQGGLYGFVLALPIVFQNRGVSYADQVRFGCFYSREFYTATQETDDFCEFQAEFSLVSYPFCFKLLWAPLIDCVFFKKFGRRKTWIIPSQYLIGTYTWNLFTILYVVGIFHTSIFRIGITLFFVSRNLDEWLGSEDGTQHPRTRLLTVIFFWSLFFSATQDVALDGWSLTMLQR